jgi:hypothetical protein
VVRNCGSGGGGTRFRKAEEACKRSGSLAVAVLLC